MPDAHREPAKVSVARPAAAIGIHAPNPLDQRPPQLSGVQLPSSLRQAAPCPFTATPLIVALWTY